VVVDRGLEQVVVVDGTVDLGVEQGQVEEQTPTRRKAQ
jgi:hypothetical protein